jgi:hypothetical protein
MEQVNFCQLKNIYYQPGSLVSTQPKKTKMLTNTDQTWLEMSLSILIASRRIMYGTVVIECA